MNKKSLSNKQSLKIGLFIASDPSTTGGIQEYVYRLMQKFEKLNHIVTVYGPQLKNKLLYPFTRYVPVSKTYHVNLKNGFQPTINGPIFPLRTRIQIWNKQHLKSFSWKKTATETLNFYRQLFSIKAV